MNPNDVVTPKSPKRNVVLAYLALLLISSALTNAVFYQVRLLAPKYVENKETFMSFSKGMQEYQSMRKEWRTRLLSNYLARYAVNVGRQLSWNKDSPLVTIELAAAIWVAAWFFLVCIVLIAAKGTRSLLYLFGTYAAVSFGYMPGIVVRVYPWDMPPLLFFSIFIVLVEHDRLPWVIPLAAVGTGFKETAGILCLALLFQRAPWKRRWVLFAGAAAASLAAKLVIDVVTRSPSALITMTIDTWALNYNIEALLGIHQNARVLCHPILVNAGTLVGFLLLPCGGRRMAMLKTICIAFVIGNFLFGVIREYRIWFEMIPVALYGFELTFMQRKERTA
jgi:hypothetical protein